MIGNAYSHRLATPRQHQRIILRTQLSTRSNSVRRHLRSPTLSQPPLHSQPRHGSQANAAAEQEGEVSTEASASGPRDPEPEDSRTAIAQGLRLFEAGQYEPALDLFAKAMKLPGTGIKRFRCVRICCFPTLAPFIDSALINTSVMQNDFRKSQRILFFETCEHQ